MAKELEKTETQAPNNVLGSDAIIYDGDRSDKMTHYKKGTPLSEIKAEHKKLFGL